MPTQNVTDKQLQDAFTKIKTGGVKTITARQLQAQIQQDHGEFIDVSTVRGRFLSMGTPLSGQGQSPFAQGNTSPTAPQAWSQFAPKKKGQYEPAPVQKKQAAIKKAIKPTVQNTIKAGFKVPDEMKKYIPLDAEFTNYVERPVDIRLSIHYNSGMYPLTQGKQGTGKTFSHMYYAWTHKLPFFLFSCFEDFKLHKFFGDKTIKNGNVIFQDGLLTQATQCPSVILFDEINAVSNENSFDFHALLQNRELFVKDADNGRGHIFRLHPECRIGFAQNPKSAKYMGGNIKPSNFLGRVTYITYPEFKKNDIKKAVEKKFPNLAKADIVKFTEFYFACVETINKAEIPVDISIRQLNHVINLYCSGLTLHDAIEDGLTSILEAVSQGKNKEAFHKIAEAVWAEMMNKSMHENVGNLSNFLLQIGGKCGKSRRKVSKQVESWETI